MEESVKKLLKKKTKTVSTSFIETKTQFVKQKKFYISLAYLLITTALLAAVSIYYHLIKCKTKQKH